MKNRYFLIVFIVLLLVTFPLLKLGYIFSLDHILIFNNFPKVGGNIYWVAIFGKILQDFGISGIFFEKILILLTFFLPVFGGYLLTKDTKNIYSLLFCSFLLIFNPFFYGRFIDGQINVYLSYAFYPLFFYFLKEVFLNTNIKNISFTAFLTLILSLTSLHNAIFLFFIIGVFITFYFNKKNIKNILKILFSIIFINLLWFVPLIYSQNTEKAELFKLTKDFGNNHFQAFSTDSGNFNFYFNTISMNGYWGERQGRFFSVVEGHKVWYVIFFMIFLISFYGLFKKFKNKELTEFDYSLLTIYIISIIFAFGISGNNIFSSINNIMYEYFPMYSGMREPHKWVMFIVIFYAYYGAFGMKNISEKINNSKKLDNFNKNLILGFLVLFPIFYVPRTLFGFYGQVKISDYPETWKEIKSIYKETENIDCKYFLEKKSEKCYDSLVFPWHGYINLNFTKKTVGGWIFEYFGKNVLYGDNMEIADIYTQSTRKESKIIEKYIGPKGFFLEKIDEKSISEFYKDLYGLGIKYIFFMQESDYKKYENIFKISEEKGFIKIIKQNKDIIFYEIQTK